jgi:hypothetical protein
MIGSHEALVADWTGEAFLTRVSAQVTLELVRTGKTLATEEPLAAERPLAGVPPKMRLEVGRLSVDFTASGYMAQVLFLLVLMTHRSTSSWILIFFI